MYANSSAITGTSQRSQDISGCMKSENLDKVDMLLFP